MHTRWIEGGDHGLVWEHGLALVQATVSLDAARAIWTGFAGGGDLSGFLKLLSSVTGSDLLSLPSFAIALRGDSGEWQLAARGDMQVQVNADVVRGAGISTWAERFVAAGQFVAVGAAGGGEGGVERPIVAGLVPACGLAWGDPADAVVAPAAVEPRRMPISPGVPESPAVAELIALPEPAALPEPEPAALPEPEPAALPEPEAAALPEPEAPVVLVESDEVPQPEPGPEPEPEAPETPAEPNPLPEPDEPAPKPADQETLMQEQQLISEEAVDLPQPTDAAASPDAAPAPTPGRFARQFGDTQLFSVEDAAVRGAGDVDFISGVPGSGSPLQPAPASAGEAIDDALSAELLGEGDHDGFTMMVSAEDAARLASAAVAAVPAVAAIVGPSVLGVECVRGHANPPHRSSCSTCGGELVGQPHRMPRPAVGRLLLPNGEHLELTAPVIVGRNPRADRVQGGTMPTLVPLSQGHVSGTHLEIRLEEWNVLAVDLHSTNGTFLRRHGEAPVRLGERPELLIEGDVLDLGHGVQLTLEHLR